MITRLSKQGGSGEAAWDIFHWEKRGFRSPVRDLLKSPGMGLCLPTPKRAGSWPRSLTLAVSETVFQFPPLRVNFPLPIRVRISSGVSLGPLANGVYLEKSPPSLGIASGLHPGARGGVGGCVSPSGWVLLRAASFKVPLPKAG